MDETGPGNDLTRVLQQFKQLRVLMGMVTFVRRPRLTRRLKIWNIEDYFQSTVTPGEVPEFKPSPDPYYRVIKEFNLASEQCVVVGDEPVDILGGKRAGTRTIGLPRGFLFGKRTQRVRSRSHYFISQRSSLDLLQERRSRH